ncbi:MAG: MgtC/SapB family protein [Ardenticatenaceae bacterium]|nr:MgtC/SapB family protein [Ardenticatenaceae bacterium]
MDLTLFYRFGVALFIGMLVGLQREYVSEETSQRSHGMFAGVRTFALMSLAGCVAAFIADILSNPWVFIGLVIPMGGLIIAAYYITSTNGDMGMTTEVAAVVTILSGALCYWDQLALAVAIGVITTALLSFKLELHGFAALLTREDIVATLKFAIITAIILPVLPNDSFGPPPFDVLNPYKVWLMVVLISGISFLGYVLIKLVGERQGIGLTGLLGGLVSSTAVTLSFSQRSQTENQLAKPFALAIIVAWTVMFARVLIEVMVTNLPLLSVVWLPITAAGAAGLLYGIYLYFAPRGDDVRDMAVSNPFELGPAITFGLLYGVILLAARTAQIYFGDTGIYVSSILSGLADVDAITLSMAELSRSGNLELSTAARAIVLATMSNTVVKGGIIMAGGAIALKKALLPGFLLILVTGVVLALLI